jgi:glycosyltransferase involved in cell wall biosynthesis
VTVSVIITTRDRAGFLRGALDALALQRGAAFEVVVADNGSSDGTAQLLAERAAGSPFPLRSVYVAEPNRGAARNRAVALASGEVLLFVDDDVVLPDAFVAAHARRYANPAAAITVSGPILNVPSSDVRPHPTIANASGAFFCTCNASVRRADFAAAGGFDERFSLYGWEDTDLGIRLRRLGLRRVFAWDAYLYHIKPPATETLDVQLQKVTEKARMAARLVAKDPTRRTRLATGAYRANLLRASLVAAPWTLPLYDRLARSARTPAPLRALAKAQVLDGTYARELRAALREAADG